MTIIDEGYPTADAFELSELTSRSTQARVTRVRTLLDQTSQASPAGENAMVRVGDVRRELGCDAHLLPRVPRPRVRTRDEL